MIGKIIVSVIFAMTIVLLWWPAKTQEAPEAKPVPEPPSLRLLRALGRVEINEGEDFRVRSGDKYSVTLRIGDILADHGAYYLMVDGRGDSLEAASAECIARLPDEIARTYATALEIQKRMDVDTK